MLKKWSIGISTIALLALGACNDDGAFTDGVSNEKVESIEAIDGNSWTDIISETPEGGVVQGNPDAPIKLIEYMSTTCGVCRSFGESSHAALRDQYIASGRVSFEIRNYARDAIDLTSTILTRCGGVDAYFARTHAVLSQQNAILNKSRSIGQEGFNAILSQPENVRFITLAEQLGLIDIFKGLGVSRDQAASCLADINAVTAIIDATAEATSEKQISGTPTFFLNGTRLNVTNWTEVEQKLREAGAR